MKAHAITAAVLAATLGFGSLAQAQGNDRRDERRGQVSQRQDQRQDQRDDRRHDRSDDRRDVRHGQPVQQVSKVQKVEQHNRYYYNARGPEFRRGGYVPREYRNRQYVVVNPRAYHLSAPPRGHQWVQVGTDYVLIAIATGIIANIVLSQ